MEKQIITRTGDIDAMFKAGAHYGFARSRRHPSTAPFVFGVKNRTEIIDLEKTAISLAKASSFVAELAQAGKQVLIVGSKNEARDAVTKVAGTIDMPFVAGRWLGGTITNFVEIKKRIAKFEGLLVEREKGELAKYTKKERLLIDRQIAKLDRFFSGLVPMRQLPGALIVIDSNKEHIAVAEAVRAGIPVVALSSTDCDIKKVQYPIVANDSSSASIAYFLNELAKAYKEGVKLQSKKEATPEIKKVV
ncbi:MAG: 30S ribosomal protein S2 [Candidatus Paceibacterota bacterium]|jgi:small subunit ribosomal protein S2